MSGDTIPEEPEAFVSYPDAGVTVSINHHQETLGKHRVRLYFPRAVADRLRRGLSFPRIHVDGTVVNGLRVWCAEQDGMAPQLAKSGSWSVTLPVRRLRGREALVASTPVPVTWERDETGPVLLIPRLPDALLPEEVIGKLPNSQVDMDTIMQRADRRLAREMAALNGDQPHPILAALDEAIDAIEPPAPVAPAPYVAPSAPAADLKEALAMVNELVDQLGDEVVLSIDPRGHVVAKRRVVQFIDL